MIIRKLGLLKRSKYSPKIGLLFVKDFFFLDSQPYCSRGRYSIVITDTSFEWYSGNVHLSFKFQVAMYISSGYLACMSHQAD